MKWSVWLLSVTWLIATVCSSQDCDAPSSLIFSSPGNVSITGIFNANEGEDCSTPVGKGLEEVAAVMWTVSLLNQQNYLPGLQIGLALYDGCSSAEKAQKTFMEALVLETCDKPDTVTIGTLTSTEIEKALDALSSSVDRTLTVVGPPLEVDHLLDMVTALLREMNLHTLHRIVADNQTILQDFGRLTAKNGICVYDEVLIDDVHARNNDVLQPSGDEGAAAASEIPIILLIASSQNIQDMFRYMNPTLFNMSDVLWILAPTDSALDYTTGLLPVNTYILSAVTPKIENLQEVIKNTELMKVPLNHRAATKSPFFLAVANRILQILQPLANFYKKNCSETEGTCPDLTEFLKNETFVRDAIEAPFLTGEAISNILSSLKMPLDEEMVLFTVMDSSKREDIAFFKIFNPETSVLKPILVLIDGGRRRRSIVSVSAEDILNRKERVDLSNETDSTKADDIIQQVEEKPRWLPPNKKNAAIKHPCYNDTGYFTKSCGICINFVKYASKVAHEKLAESDNIVIDWRYETWVGINASLASVGVLCTLAIMLFVTVRICLGDILEGNPTLSYFLLVSLIITYTSTLAFSFEATGHSGDVTIASSICDLRVFGPPVSYAIIFSILFSRSLMLASSDQDGGFMSHVNGYLQAVIIFFVCAVQFAFSGEFYYFNSFLKRSSTSCQTMYNNEQFILLLSYDAFLLLLLLAVIPFMCRSKRNYREGVFFSVAISLVFLIWCTWIPLFFFLPPSYRDVVVVFGLNSTATAILICVFISRSYLMTTAIVRDHIVNTLPPLTHPDANYRSTVALYDAVNLNTKMGVPNPNFYATNPSEPPTPNIRSGQYYSADNGVKVPTPKRMAPQPRLQGTISPEPVYDSFDTPVRSPHRSVTRF